MHRQGSKQLLGVPESCGTTWECGPSAAELLTFQDKPEIWIFVWNLCWETVVPVRERISVTSLVCALHCWRALQPCSRSPHFYHHGHCCLCPSPPLPLFAKLSVSFPLSFPVILWFCLEEFNSLSISLVNNRALFFQAMNQLNPKSDLPFRPLVIYSRWRGNHINSPILCVSCSHIRCRVTLWLPSPEAESPSAFGSGPGRVVCCAQLSEVIARTVGHFPA